MSWTSPSTKRHHLVLAQRLAASGHPGAAESGVKPRTHSAAAVQKPAPDRARVKTWLTLRCYLFGDSSKYSYFQPWPSRNSGFTYMKHFVIFLSVKVHQRVSIGGDTAADFCSADPSQGISASPYQDALKEGPQGVRTDRPPELSYAAWPKPCHNGCGR